MIDNYTITAIIIRSLTALLLVAVFIKQLKLMRPVTKVQWVKVVLIILVAIMLSNAVMSVTFNFFRQEDGNLIPGARHTSLIVNAVAGFASAIGYAILYFRRDE